MPLENLLVVVFAEYAETSNGKVVFRMPSGKAYHVGEATLYFLASATGEKGYGWQLAFGQLLLVVNVPLADGIDKGVPDIGCLGHVVGSVELLLERQNVAKAVQVAAHAFKTPLLPCP